MRINRFILLIALCALSFSAPLLLPAQGLAIAQIVSPAIRAQTMNGAAGSTDNELLVFEINRPIVRQDRGFPREDPPAPATNGNWTTPVNFADGKLYYRVEIRSQPMPKQMLIQFCVWQDDFVLENCGPLKEVNGTPGTVVMWEQPVRQMWKLNEQPVDWTRPRQRYAFAIKNSLGLPVSNYEGWNWNGENPDEWYPLDARMSVVAVAAGQQFSGWHN
ncbi:MAG: hypothetical protein KDE47_13770, partial [Caldilineaceae bacterium]|nr:hypothetical protein [Caldilineaceae bacterium]